MTEQIVREIHKRDREIQFLNRRISFIHCQLEWIRSVAAHLVCMTCNDRLELWTKLDDKIEECQSLTGVDEEGNVQEYSKLQHLKMILDETNKQTEVNENNYQQEFAELMLQVDPAMREEWAVSVSKVFGCLPQDLINVTNRAYQKDIIASLKKNITEVAL